MRPTFSHHPVSQSETSLPQFEFEWSQIDEFLDEDSINQQAYLEGLERDLSIGFPRYIESVFDYLPVR